MIFHLLNLTVSGEVYLESILKTIVLAIILANMSIIIWSGKYLLLFAVSQVS